MKKPLPLSSVSSRVSETPIGEMMQRALANPGLVSLAAGFVDNESLPTGPAAAAVSRLFSDAVRGKAALQYGTNQGNERLRELLAARIAREPATAGTAGRKAEDLARRIVLTQGSQQMLYLLGEVLLDPGDIVLVETPTYFVYLDVLKTRGARVIGVETDDQGIVPRGLEAALARIDAAGELDRVKLIYTVSEHNNPTGLSLAANRRGPLVETARRWSKRNRILVLEDSAYRGLNYDAPEPATIWSHDTERDTVILCRTFSKTLSPGLRCGYSVLPEDLVGPVLAIKGGHDFGSAHAVQAVLAELVASGEYDAHIERLRTVYRGKRDALIEALAAHFQGDDEAVAWTKPAGGIYVWAKFPEGLDTSRGSAFFERALEEGVLYVPGDLAYPDGGDAPPPRRFARLAFGVPSERELALGVKRLEKAFARCTAAVGS